MACKVCHDKGTFERYSHESDYGMRGDTVSIYNLFYCTCGAGRKLYRDDYRKKVARLEKVLVETQAKLDAARKELARALRFRGKKPVWIESR